MEKSYLDIIRAIGEDETRAGLLKTPHRAAKAIEFLTKGYNDNLNDVVNDAIFPSDNDEMIIVKDIEFYSLCEHHMLPFYGQCHIGYLPDGHIIGLSKIARIVDVFARRLQVQENMTKEIAETVLKYTKGKGVGVVVEGKHFCMMMRGVEKQHSYMKTSCMLGTFRRDMSTRNEFLSLIRD